MPAYITFTEKLTPFRNCVSQWPKVVCTQSNPIPWSISCRLTVNNKNSFCYAVTEIMALSQNMAWTSSRVFTSLSDFSLVSSHLSNGLLEKKLRLTALRMRWYKDTFLYNTRSLTVWQKINARLGIQMCLSYEKVCQVEHCDKNRSLDCHNFVSLVLWWPSGPLVKAFLMHTDNLSTTWHSNMISLQSRSWLLSGPLNHNLHCKSSPFFSES